MKMTSNYGMRNSQVHETGHLARPLPVWGKEDHSGMARSSGRYAESLPLEDMVQAYVLLHGERPSKLHVKVPSNGLRLIGRSYRGIGYIGLTLVYDSNDDYLA